MRILLLAPYFFPYENPRAYRWTAIAQQWAQQGWEVHVLCSKHKEWPAYQKWNGIHIHRAGFNAAKEWAYHHFPGTPHRGAQKPNPERKKTRLPLLRLNDWLLKSWYWPDDAWIWIAAARKKAQQLLNSGNWDALISTSPPFSAHWVAKKLKAQFPSLFWLADFGDPFSLQTTHPFNNLRLYQQKNKSAESAVLKSADHVVVTNSGLEEAYKKAFPGLKTSIQVIPPMASPQPNDQNTSIPDPEVLHLGYFGSFFRNIREPGPLLRFLEKNLGNDQRWHLYNKRWHLQSKRWHLDTQSPQKRWHLHLYGSIFEEFWPVFDRFPNLRCHLFFHDTLPRSEVISRMQQMDVLVMLGNTTSFQLPSKWADYLVAGKPVLHLMQTPRDPALSMVEEEGQVLSVPISEIDERLFSFLERSKKWESSEAQTNKWEKRFSGPGIAAKYAALLAT